VAVVQIACNRNANLINALKEEGLIEEIGSVLSDYVTDTYIGLYEGKDHWYFEIWRYDQDYECIVPKTVSKDDAIDMVLYKELREDVEYYEDDCKFKKGDCLEDCIRQHEDCMSLYEDEEMCDESYEKCLEDCEREYESCLDEFHITELYKSFTDAREDLSEKRIMFVGCFDGAEVGHPDIDEVCVFRL